MSDINPNSVKSVSMREIKLLDQFLKVYHAAKDAGENSIKDAVEAAYNGGLSDKAYNEYIEKLGAYTNSGTVPTMDDWAEIRAQFRDYGNGRIKQAKEDLEEVAKAYSGVASIQYDNAKLLSPKQVVERAKSSERKVRIAVDLKVIVAVICGAIGFFAGVLVCRIFADNVVEKTDGMLVHILGGVLSVAGLCLGAFLGLKLMNVIVKVLKKARDQAEFIESKNHSIIVDLVSKIQAAQENIKRIEAQYEVEVLAQTDFSRQLKEQQRTEHKVKKSKKTSDEMGPETEQKSSDN